MITGYGVVGFRDPYGIRPIGLRRAARRRRHRVHDRLRSRSRSTRWASSWSATSRRARRSTSRIDGKLHKRQCAANPIYSPCIFEYVYLARPDSVIDDIYVYKARLRMGEKLAEKILREWPDHDIDVVIPIPDT